jgi:hypothetical protein
VINTSDACAAESAVICRTQANALRGLGVEGSDAAGRKTPDNHAQIEWNLRRSLRNAAIGAQLIQPEGLEVSPLQTSQLPLPCTPADPQEPVRVIDLHAGGDELTNLQKEVAGFIDIVAHKEADIVINDEGRINGSPVNVRVTHWILQD